MSTSLTAPPPAPPPKLAIRGLEQSYRSDGKRTVALRDVDLDIADGEFVAIVGPSGCGKSTLLKIVAGLLDHTRGEIHIDGAALGSKDAASVGLVFQNDALLPWRTVYDNIRFPLVIGKRPAAEQEARVRELLTMVGLADFADFFPRQLSGGMRKRVALARTMAYDPDVYLMDEPFGPLDAQTRVRLGAEFLRIWEGLGKSVLFVTHDVEEAIGMADRVVVMSARPGRIKSEHIIDFERPRDFEEVRESSEFRRLHRAIWNELH